MISLLDEKNEKTVQNILTKESMAEHNENFTQENYKNASEKESSIQKEEKSPKIINYTIRDFFLPSKNQLAD